MTVFVKLFCHLRADFEAYFVWVCNYLCEVRRTYCNWCLLLKVYKAARFIQLVKGGKMGSSKTRKLYSRARKSPIIQVGGGVALSRTTDETLQWTFQCHS